MVSLILWINGHWHVSPCLFLVLLLVMVSKIAVSDNTKPVELTCSAQNYDWGIMGSESLVGKIYEKNNGVRVQSDKPYAEVLERK